MKSGTKRQKRPVFKGIDITLITILSVVAAGIIAFSGIIIWLVSSL